MQNTQVALIAACVAAVPPFLTILIGLFRDAYVLSGRARRLDEARKLAEFVKAYADAVTAAANTAVGEEARTQMASMLTVAAARGENTATLIKQLDAPRPQLSIRHLVFPAWPATRRERVLAFMYYYMLLGTVLALGVMWQMRLSMRSSFREQLVVQLVVGVIFAVVIRRRLAIAQHAVAA